MMYHLLVYCAFIRLKSMMLTVSQATLLHTLLYQLCYVLSTCSIAMLLETFLRCVYERCAWHCIAPYSPVHIWQSCNKLRDRDTLVLNSAA